MGRRKPDDTIKVSVNMDDYYQIRDAEEAVELLKEESPNDPGNIAGVQLIPIEKVRAFKDHPFHLF